ncbi:hypothetical protein PLESTM_000281000 [Pleodorina starrii]|nr:hypothetical protein PLESTM_000281000 [Pleodorina starrii]
MEIAGTAPETGLGHHPTQQLLKGPFDIDQELDWATLDSATLPRLYRLSRERPIPTTLLLDSSTDASETSADAVVTAELLRNGIDVMMVPELVGDSTIPKLQGVAGSMVSELLLREHEAAAAQDRTTGSTKCG